MKYRKPTRAERTVAFYQNLGSLGLSADDVTALLRAERTLRSWHELECGTGNDRVTESIERDEQTGKPFKRVQYWSAGKWIDRKAPCRDMEKGALRRVAAICARVGLGFYQQGDPRGCALYLIRPGDVPEGADVDCYYSRGLAVCIN